MANTSNNSNAQKQLKVLVPLAQGCEELEAVTITDLLTRAGMKVTTVGLDDKPVIASRGMVLLPETNIDAVMDLDFDVIVLPGGLPGAEHLQQDPRLQRKLQSMAAANKTIGAICAAPMALASAGLLDGKTFTSFPGSLDKCVIKGGTHSSDSVVVDNNIITSQGPGTAMDFVLRLIEELLGKQKRIEVEIPLMRVVST